MRECPSCKACLPDDYQNCPTDGSKLLVSLPGNTELDSRYHLEKRLGQGGMGIVFKARHIFLKTSHAVKIILPDLVGNDPELLTRFRQEAMAAAAIRHQNVVTVTDFGVALGNMPFLVMEFVQGESLHELLAREKKLGPVRALEIMAAIGSGVAAAHRREIVHRDLKPLNIMMQSGMSIRDGLKVLDFGLAKIKSGELLGSFVAAKTTGMMGSPSYMAPEQWSDEEEPDRRADIYSLGIIFYQMLTGELPFRGSGIPVIMRKHMMEPPPPMNLPGLSELEAVVRRALEKNPKDRPQTTEEFLYELQQAVATVTASEDTAPETRAEFQRLTLSEPLLRREPGRTTDATGEITASDLVERGKQHPGAEGVIGRDRGLVTRADTGLAGALQVNFDQATHVEPQKKSNAETKSDSGTRRVEGEAMQRLEEEARQLALKFEEAQRQAEEAHKLAEQESLKRAEEESARRRAEEELRGLAEKVEEAQKRAEEARRVAEEESAKRIEEEKARKAAQEEGTRKLHEELALKRAEQSFARRRAEENAEARARQAEDAQQRAEEALERAEEVARRLIAEEAARKQAEEEARIKAQEADRLAREIKEVQLQIEEARKREEKALRDGAEHERRLHEEQQRRSVYEGQAPSTYRGSDHPGAILGTSPTGQSSVLPGSGELATAWPQQVLTSAGNGADGSGQASVLRNQAPGSSTVITAEKTSSKRILAVIGGLVVVLLAVGAIAIFSYLHRSGPSATVPKGSTYKATGGVPQYKAPEMVSIPGGTFQMGRSDVSQLFPEWPAHSVKVEGFLLGRTEVTNGEYSLFVQETGHPAPEDWGGDNPPPGKEQFPVARVSFEDAEAFAAWRSKHENANYRLPSEEEWEYAARGGDKSWVYPWGNDWNEARANLGAGMPTPVGSYPQGRNLWNAEDMIGNVWEWTSSKFSIYPGNTVLRVPPVQESWIVIRGGSFASMDEKAIKTRGSKEFPAATRQWIAPTIKTPTIGFRLARKN